MILTAFCDFLSSPALLKGCEIFSMVTFAIFLVLEIFHHKLMWYVYIPSCIAAAYVFLHQQTWAMGVLNIYYIVMGVLGLVRWNKESQQKTQDKGILLNKMSRRDALISLVITIIGIPVLYFTLRSLNDPYPLLDAITTTLSIIATWWLTCSYIQQWYIWIVADIFAIGLNYSLGNIFLAIQFVICTISSFVGIWLWKKNGKILSE